MLKISDYKERISLDAILQYVAEVTNQKPEEIRCGKRLRHLADARHIFRFISKNQGYGFTEIAKFQFCDHATIIHSVKTAKDLIEIDGEFRMMIRKISNRIQKRIGVTDDYINGIAQL